MPTKKYLHNIDLAQNQLQKAVIENSAYAPSSPVDGQVYYNTSDKKIYYYNSQSSSWVALFGGTAVTSVALSAPTGFSISGSPITQSGTLQLSFASGYSLPLITSQANWDTAYGWGNHASGGYLTTAAAALAYQPLDADLSAIAVLSGTSGFLKKNAANTWSLDTNTYLTSYTETDPVFIASAAFGITGTNITNWNTAYSWGNHSSAGYQLTSAKGVANGYASLDS